MRIEGGYVTYAFTLPNGEFYGGEGATFQFRPRELVTLVLYDIKNPDANLIVMSCVFHRLKVIGRGVTDLEAAKTSASLVAKPVRLQA